MTNYNLNLVSGHTKLTKFAAGIFGISGLVFILLGSMAVWEASNIRAELQPIQKRIAVLEKLRASYLAALKDAPNETEINDLSDRINQLSKKISLNGQMTSVILHELEITLPDRTYLKEFEYPFEKGLVRILLMTESDTELGQALQSMERNDKMNNIVLAGQSRRDDQDYSVMADIHFSMLCCDK